MQRPRVLLLAYMLSPKRGSEYAVAWNHVTWMSRYCDITVLFGAAGAHMGDKDEINEIIQKELLPGVRFIFVPPPLIAKILNYPNRIGLFAYTFYLAYQAWHLRAGQVAKELVQESEFDVVHYLGPIGYREPGVLWKLELPYIWGPIGGALNLPLQLAAALPTKGKLKLFFRSAVNWVQLRCSLRVRKALKRANVLLTATTENQTVFQNVLGAKSYYFPENGIVGNVILNSRKFDSIGRIRLIWIGTVEPRKALRILVDAFAILKSPKTFEVHIVGDGPLKSALQADIDSMGLTDSFIWHGQIDRSAVLGLLEDAHLHVITSVSEGNPTTIWEAMANGVPTLSIDHCGMHDSVKESAGLKVPLGPYEEIVQGFANKLDALAIKPQLLREMADCVVQDAESFHWSSRTAFWLDRYDEAIKVYDSSRRVR